MGKPNYKQIYAIKKQNEQRITKVNPNLKNESGIYFFTRTDENGVNHSYVGQSVKVKDRVVSHLSGYEQHIDKSIKAHGLYDSDKNPYGWKVNALYYPKDKLDEMERYWILEYMKHGHQSKNVLNGGQGVGKFDIAERKPAKGYRDGLAQGEKNLAKKIKHLFDLHLDVKPKSDPPTRYQRDALEKFNELISTEE